MANAEIVKMEGTPEQLAARLGQLSSQRRYRIVEVEEPATDEMDTCLPDPNAAASIALLKSWIAQAPTDPEAIKEAEDDLRELKKNLNAPRKETGARLLFPEVE